MAQPTNQTSSAGPGSLLHRALLFSSDEELSDLVSGFVRTALDAGDPVTCAASERTHELVRTALGARADAVVFADRNRWFRSPGRAVAHLRHALDDQEGPARLWLVGEQPWDRRSPDENREWCRYEAALDEVLDAIPVSTLCLFDRRRVGQTAFEQAYRTHPHLLSDAGAQPNGQYVDPVTVAAQCARSELPEPDRTVDRTITASTVPAARELVGEMALLCEIPFERTQDFQLAVHEILSNAIEHAGGCARLRVWCDATALICEVRDEGGGIADPFAGYRTPSTEQRRGRGLWMAHQLCDLVQVRSHSSGSRVRLHLAF